MNFKILETLILTSQNELDNTEGYPSALSALQDHLQEKKDNNELEDEQAALLDWIDALIADKKAADLYLEYWQLGEKPAAIGDMEKMNQIASEIDLLGYPNPRTIVFDNEAVPRIFFQNPNFNCTAYYESKLADGLL